MRTMRRFLCWVARLFLAGATFFSFTAQSPSQTRDISEPQAKEIVHTPALEYTIAFLFVILVLFILCKPSRKA
jgi:hypothetical protein